MKWILPIFLICLFYSVPAAALYLTGIKSVLRSVSKRDITVVFVLSAGLLSVVMALVAREHYVYFWDYGSYWRRALQYQRSLGPDFSENLKLLISSINNDEYNQLACAVIALPLKVFNNSYFAFVILNTVLFYIPNAFLMAFTFFKILEKYSLHTINITWICSYTLLFSAALFPVLAGYVDIIGMIPLTTAYLLVIDRDFERVQVRKDLLLGISFLWIIFLRRYYAYAAVGGAVFAFLFWSTYGTTREDPFYRIKNKLIDTLTAISVPAAALAVVFRKFFLNSVLNNHLQAYSAYKTTDYLGAWGLFGRYFGLLFSALIILGILCNIRGDIGKLVISLLVGVLTSCTLFFRIQNMGTQHYYVAVFPVCCFIFLGIHALLFIPMPGKRKLISFGINGIVVLVVIVNFLMSVGIGTAFKSILWESYSYIPKVRHDFNALYSLERCLEDLEHDGFHGVYCLGSNGILNSSILNNLNAPDAYPEFPIATSDVDLRDGFWTSFFDYDIIIACDPVQTHLPQGQEVIIKLNEVMLTANTFSKHYTVKDSFVLDKDVQALVYVKQEPLEAADIEYIRDIFHEVYPDYPELFADRINTYLSENY